MKGFTLIETIVYMALLGLIMTGALITAFDLISSTQNSAGKTTVQEEGTFVARKLEWALSDMSAAPTIFSVSSCNQMLTVNKTGYAKNPIVFQLNTTNHTIEITEAGGSPVALTTNNVSATCLKFGAIAAVGSAPPGVTATTTLSGLDFVKTKYVRK